MPAINEISARNILCKSGLAAIDYSLNPYVGCVHACKYCYAAALMRNTGHSDAWGEYVDVKNWNPVLNNSRYRGKTIFIGSATDPYQPAELTYGRTRLALAQLKGSGCLLRITTKSPLALRDIELIKSFPGACVSFSINTLDPDLQKRLERAPGIEKRLEAMKTFHEAGVYVSCFIAPLFPGLTNPFEIIRRVNGICDEIYIDRLNLRGNSKPAIMGFIARHYPSLLHLYRDIYYSGDTSWEKDMGRQIEEFRNLEPALSQWHNGNKVKTGARIRNYLLVNKIPRNNPGMGKMVQGNLI